MDQLPDGSPGTLLAFHEQPSRLEWVVSMEVVIAVSAHQIHLPQGPKVRLQFSDQRIERFSLRAPLSVFVRDIGIDAKSQEIVVDGKFKH